VETQDYTREGQVFGKRAAVLGAGLAGLMAAAALRPYFDDVVVIEKDRLPETPQPRKGVPQGHHVHTLLGFGVDALESLLPGVLDALYAAGAVQIRRNFDIWFHDNDGPTPIRDVGILTPSVTRPLLEHVVRAAVLKHKNVRVCDDTRALGLLTDASGAICGLRAADSKGERDEFAQVVVDCSGRGSRVPKWLREMGHSKVPVRSLNIAMSYTSGHFRLKDHEDAAPPACLMLASPQGLRAAYITPVDGGLTLTTLYGRAGDNAPLDQAGFTQWTQGLPHPIVHTRLQGATLVGSLKKYAIPTGLWVRYDQMPDLPAGLVPMGEAVTSFNPMYGQGISLAAGQALALRAALHDASEANRHPNSVAPSYFSASHELNEVGWSVMETRDFVYASTQGSRPDDLDARWQSGRAVRRLAEHDNEVHSQNVRVTHLLDHPRKMQTLNVAERLAALDED
jgi:2-polyprenyl-6-methoxyphenol hydroxylase-like FAD-dependent oxidoreductase